MRVIYKPGNTYEEINCYDFREYEQGIVLHNEEGYNIGYIPHEILSHIEPHPGERVAFDDNEGDGDDDVTESK
ncbi:hypothetical protein [Halostagnicola sp. A-GB9-2]|uniref:hypothetical protein n=1 Tax=Halostagnicola sp. A-GB9-2 TaxID=3048066 RepID=UPI0024C0038D|nr:hypothetical protein [Halostagnicola sp. A-GB9-2]MDJ1434090.1 hypothetical protein [Halostagnicola sp. A-GB9-2]